MTIKVGAPFVMAREVGDAGADTMGLAIAERSHAMSMSQDPANAAQGRFVKEAAPAFMRWIEAEARRARSDKDLAASTQGLIYGLSNMLLSWAGSVADAESAVELAKAMAADIIECIDAAGEAKIAERIAAARKGAA